MLCSRQREIVFVQQQLNGYEERDDQRALKARGGIDGNPAA